MLTRSIAAMALLSGAATAKYCMNMTIPINISSRNAVFDNLETPTDNLGATDFALSATRQGFNGTAAALTGYATVSGSYNISGKLCMPNAPSSSNSSMTPTLQILTHGIGFDKTYWDFAYNDFNYSYTNVALDAGYHTFAYDRLGIGHSSHGEPKNEIQSFLEIAALAELTNMLRNGTLMGAPAYTRIVHVGHSFGSAQTFAMTAMYPDISDGIVLTGFSMNGTVGVPLFNAGANYQQAFLNQPFRFGSKALGAMFSTLITTYRSLGDLLAPVDFTDLDPYDYPPGYLVNSDAGTTNFLFLLNGYFDPMLLPVAEAGKQPVTVGEGLTLGSVPAMNTFTGPVLVLTGSNDVPYCGGDCFNTGDPQLPSIPAAVGMNVPGANPFISVIQPNTGHGINFHYNATGAYELIQSFFLNSGLAAFP